MAVDWEGLARANTHPLRVEIAEAYGSNGGRAKLSPKQLSVKLNAPLSNVNYHVTELVNSDLLKPAAERQVRGAVEHFYRQPTRKESKEARAKWKGKGRGKGQAAPKRGRRKRKS